MLKTLLKKAIMNSLSDKNKQPKKSSRKERRQQKRNYRNQMVKMFGKTRWYLSYWFGTWILFLCNSRDYSRITEKPYEKFYKNFDVAQRYEKRLKEAYEDTEIVEVYDNRKTRLGYMLTGTAKKIAEATQQPSNVISFLDYRRCKAN